MKRLQGDTHGLNKRDLPSPLLPLLDIVQVKCNQYSVLSSAGLCISVKSALADNRVDQTHRERGSERQKADAGFAARAFMLPGL